jgi:hypothetical protein
MIHPSYTELMAVINSEVEEGEQPLVQSRYSIVKATANRAKEIIDARSVEEKIAKAREDYKAGKGVTCKTIEQSMSLLESL